MEKQRSRAKAAGKFVVEPSSIKWKSLIEGDDSIFTGYDFIYHKLQCVSFTRNFSSTFSVYITKS